MLEVRGEMLVRELGQGLLQLARWQSNVRVLTEGALVGRDGEGDGAEEGVTCRVQEL